MEPCGNNRKAGYSLLETFIALLILSAGLLSLAAVQLSTLASRYPASTPGVLAATSLAQESIDRLGALPFAHLASSPPGGFQVGPYGLSPAFHRLAASAGDIRTVQGTTFYRIWQVSRDPVIPALKTITVWCCWRQPGGTWRHVALVTQRSDAEY